MNQLRRIIFALMLLPCMVLSAQEKRDEIPSGFRAYIVNEPRYTNDQRNRTGKMQDLVCDHGLNPVLAVFSRTIPKDATHPLNQIVKKQDDLVKDYVSRRFGSYLVFLALVDEFRKDETRDDRKAEIQTFVNDAKPTLTTIGLAEATETPDGAAQALVPAQVTGMGIAPEDDLVIVLYYRFTVIKRWKFKADAPPTEENLNEINTEVVKLLGKAPKRAMLDPTPEPKKAEPKKDE